MGNDTRNCTSILRVSVIVICILGGAIIFVVFVRRLSSPVNTTPHRTPQPPPTPALNRAETDFLTTWSVYNNTRYGYAFKYPATYRISETSSDGSVEFLTGGSQDVDKGATYPLSVTVLTDVVPPADVFTYLSDRGLQPIDALTVGGRQWMRYVADGMALSIAYVFYDDARDLLVQVNVDASYDSPPKILIDESVLRGMLTSFVFGAN